MNSNLKSLSAAWRLSWNDRIPSASDLGVDDGDFGIALTFLPGGRKYPTEEGDLNALLESYLEVLQVLSQDFPLGGSPTILISHGWRTLENGDPARDEFLSSLTPDAAYWRTDDTGIEPGFVSLLHSYCQVIDRIEDALPVIELFCVDSTDDVLISDCLFRWTAVLRNGGLDLLSEDPAFLARAAKIFKQHPDWNMRKSIID